VTKGEKKPRAAWQPKGQKQPRGGSFVPNISTMNFKWRCDRLDWDGPWSWHKIGLQLALSDVIPRLHQFETMTWAEVEGPTGSHFIDCQTLCKDAQDRLQKIQENTDQLFSLRLGGKYRLWGVRDLATLRLVWWDPDHSVYPTEKKNT